MSTPVDEIKEPQSQPFPSISTQGKISGERSSRSPKRNGDDEHTVVGEEGSDRHNSPHAPFRPRLNTHDRLQIPVGDMSGGQDDQFQLRSPSANREAAFRLEDDLTLLKAERLVSKEEQDRSLSHTRSRSRRREEPVDDFDVDTNPIHEKISVYRPPTDPNTNIGKLFKRIHNSIWLVRYFVYITPLTVILLIPLLVGALKFQNATVGGVKLVWFSAWLEIVWLSLWAGRIIAKCLPWPIGLITSMFSNNSKKWRDMMKQLELAATLFFWALAVEISFLPTMTSHHADGNTSTKHWEGVMNKVLISFLVAMALNFAEKIIIQLIAISFHLRTYADRIDINKFQIASLVKLYEFSKSKIGLEDQEFEEKSGPASGAITPRRVLHGAQQNTTKALNKFGDVAGKIAGDFTGKKVALSSHPQQVVLSLLATGEGSQVIARRLYRTFCREETETVYSDDLRPAFENDDEANAAFTMFDKDMNGDISMEELEAVCVEIGRERKSITASLKDLDSVVSKLDDVFVFIVCVITLLVFISLISTSAAGVLTSAGSAVLALSWLFSATAQEFLQSIIFVFVKHPFDVGDRVSIYGNTGSLLKGDDYFVKEISLLYTEFKKMEGHIVQAPNSYLNTIFILNQRRSGGLAEAVPVTVKFGTTLDQIDGLRSRLLEFVTSEKREYQSNILTELRDITEAHAITLNVVFFYKSNWQNELLRLQRRNKFICAMMISMQELGIEGPRMRYPGQKESFPVYLQNVPHQAALGGSGASQPPPSDPSDVPFVEPLDSNQSAPTTTSTTLKTLKNHPSILNTSRHSRPRGESLAQMGRRVDFSLGMRDVTNSNLTGDVFDQDDRERSRQLAARLLSPAQQHRSMLASANATGRASGSMDSRRRRGSTIVAAGANNPGSGNGNHPFPLAGADINRSTSMMSSHAAALGSRLTRVGTDSSLAAQRSNHRNRFFSTSFGRSGGGGGGGGIGHRVAGSGGVGAGGVVGTRHSLDDGYEASGYDNRDAVMAAEEGMAGIPEMSRVNSRLDPRSGRVSPTAWRRSEDEKRV